jgi:hypothetical protein
MSGFLQRPDSVQVRDDQERTYIDTPGNFEADFGVELPALPEGVTERFYRPGKAHALNNGGDTIGGGDMPWAFAENVFPLVADALVLKAARDNPPPPEPEPNAVPASVTPLQARRALRQAGLLAAVEAAVAQADDDTQDAWQYALSIERSNPIIAALAAQLDMTDEQIDDLFRLAATL